MCHRQIREMIELGLRSAYFLKRQVSQECNRIIRVLPGFSCPLT